MKLNHKVLIFRIGQLGDTLVSVPAIKAIREYFPKARLTLLCDRQIGKRYVLASEVFQDLGLVDDYLLYPVAIFGLGRVFRPFWMAMLMIRLRLKGFKSLFYLAPSNRTKKQIDRDLVFFRMCGIKEFIGVQGFHIFPKKIEGQPLPALPQEADLLLARLGLSGIPVPGSNQARVDLPIRYEEQFAVLRWLKKTSIDGKKILLAVGPGSKMPAKMWPLERYGQVIKRLIKEFDIYPVIFGGPSDRAVGETLIAQWGRGISASGHLNIREGIAAMRHCAFYLGNDTGVLHMAVAAGLRCVGLYSARDYPGWWYPYGEKHVVFRKWVACEGCRLLECRKNQMKCLKLIEEEEVYQACKKILDEASC